MLKSAAQKKGNLMTQLNLWLVIGLSGKFKKIINLYEWGYRWNENNVQMLGSKKMADVQTLDINFYDCFVLKSI